MKNIQPFLSVILPTYNRKHCISRMIDSVLMQSFEDFELIIIDDGSTDGSVEFLQEHYEDKRIRIARKENGGVSSARNLGISMALGKYITFVDSDDYLLEGFFEDIYQTLNMHRCDVLVYGGYILKSNQKKEVPLFWFDQEYDKRGIEERGGREFVEEFCRFGGNSWGCAKVFSRELIAKHQISFDENVTYGEDMLFNLHAYLSASSVVASPKKFYVCDCSAESISRGMISAKGKVENLMYVYRCLKENKELKSQFALNCLRHMRRWIFLSYFLLDKNTKQEIQAMYHEVSLEDCKSYEVMELKLAKRNFFYAPFLFLFIRSLYFCYKKVSFLHPITSPIIKWIKAKKLKSIK